MRKEVAMNPILFMSGFSSSACGLSARHGRASVRLVPADHRHPAPPAMRGRVPTATELLQHLLGFAVVALEIATILLQTMEAVSAERSIHPIELGMLKESRPEFEILRPVQIGPLWIGPSWHDAPADATAIVLDPGRAFGTGAHATTRLCIELLLEEQPCPVIDIGCGSGVLSIAAAKLGFAPVLALDSDENAVAATAANAAANGVSVETRHADLLIEEPPASELVLANITRQVLEELAPRLRCGRLVSSGYLPTDEVELATFNHVRRVTQDGWAADLYEAAQ